MNDPRSAFAGGDQSYLRHEQYSDGARLTRRANLHVKYRTAAEPWFDWVGAKFSLFEGAEVLEAGCGTGWLWSQSNFPIPPEVVVTLTDLSPGMVGTALSRVHASGRVHQADGLAADLQALPFPEASFDLVVANHMLYHLLDPGWGVAEMARVARPDGMVVAGTNGRRHLRELWELRGRVFGTPPVDQTADVFDPGIGFRLLGHHFDDVRWLAYPDRLRCTDPADVMAYLCSTPPAETATPDD